MKSLFDLQAKYGGFIDENGKLILQCPFHGNRFPSVIVWVGQGEYHFECKLGCDDARLKEFFLNGLEKVYYMPDWKPVKVINRMGMDQKWIFERHRAFFVNQLNMLARLKDILRAYYRELWDENRSVTLAEFKRIALYRRFIKVLLGIIGKEQGKCKEQLNQDITVVNAGKRKNGLIEDDIKRARNVPVEMLYDFRIGKAICPFHEDKNPSLVVWKRANKIRCFGCNKTWDSIQFIMDLKGMEFKEAVEYLNNL